MHFHLCIFQVRTLLWWNLIASWQINYQRYYDHSSIFNVWPGGFITLAHWVIVCFFSQSYLKNSAKYCTILNVCCYRILSWCMHFLYVTKRSWIEKSIWPNSDFYFQFHVAVAAAVGSFKLLCCFYQHVINERITLQLHVFVSVSCVSHSECFENWLSVVNEFKSVIISRFAGLIVIF